MTRTRMPAGYYCAWLDSETLGVYHMPSGGYIDECKTKQDAIRIAWEHKEANRPLTLAQARAKAKERWGQDGWAQKIGKTWWVGTRTHGKGCIADCQKGFGDTLNDAFADADRREAEAKEKMSNGN